MDDEDTTRLLTYYSSTAQNGLVLHAEILRKVYRSILSRQVTLSHVRDVLGIIGKQVNCIHQYVSTLVDESDGGIRRRDEEILKQKLQFLLDLIESVGTISRLRYLYPYLIDALQMMQTSVQIISKIMDNEIRHSSSAFSSSSFTARRVTPAPSFTFSNVPPPLPPSQNHPRQQQAAPQQQTTTTTFVFGDNATTVTPLEVMTLLARVIGLEDSSSSSSSSSPGLTEEQIQHVLHPIILGSEQPCSVTHIPHPEGATMYRLPCTHCFSMEGIRPWLQAHRTCPVCRADVLGGGER